MNALRTLATACLAFGLIALGPTVLRGSDDKETNKQKVLGNWELVKSSDKNGPPPGTTIAFTKDGKFKLKAKVGDKEIAMEGTYSVDGDKLRTAMKGPDGKEQSDTDTITKLTDKEMVLKGSKGEVTEFKKK